MDDGLASLLLGSIAADNLVVFCGAGLSMAPPSAVPSARQIAIDCFPKYQQAIGTAIAPDKHENLEAQCKYAFERGELHKLFLDKLVDWRPFFRNPNKGHKTLADFLATRALRLSVTTNFDVLVERAAEELGEDVFEAALDAADAEAGRPHQTYLKIHGCAGRDRKNTLWCKEQIVVGSLLQQRIGSSKTWLQANLLGKDLVLVGFWSDWDYLNKIFEDCITGLEAKLVVLVDPLPAASLQTKAPALWAWANKGPHQFHHAQESGADFLDELRRRFSIQFLEAVVENAKAVYKAMTGKNYIRPRSFDAHLSTDELYSLRRDVEGVPSIQIARKKKPAPEMQQVGSVHMRLIEAGAVFNGPRYLLNSKRIRVLQGAGDVLSLIKKRFDSEVLPIGDDIVICVGASDDGGVPASIVRGASPATIISAATAQISDTGDLAAAETGLRSLLRDRLTDSTPLVSLARAELGSLRNRAQSLLALANRLNDVEKALWETQTPAHQENVKQMEGRLSALREKRAQIEKAATVLEERLRQQRQSQPLLESWASLHEHGKRLGLQNGNCPLCASPVSEENFVSQLQKIRADVSRQNSALVVLIQERTKLSVDLQSSVNDIQATERQYQDLIRMSQTLRKEQVQIKEEINRILNASSHGSDIAQDLEKEANNMRQQAAQLEKYLSLLETSKTVERVGQLRKQLEEYRKQGDAIDAKISKHKILSEKFKEAASALKRISGELVDDRLAELSPLLQEIYARLRPHVDWAEISYLIRGDVRRFLSLRVGDDLNPRFMFSNGQRRAVGLAFLLAVHLSRSWCRLDSLILDDPVQHIDDYRALHLVEVLHAIRRSGRQIICTLEDEALASLLCRRLRTSEGEGGTMFRMGYVPNSGVAVVKTERFMSLPKISILAA